MKEASNISVVIPSFNRWYCLPRALDSVLAQTLPPAEIIVVDDGSDDGTSQNIAQQYPNVRLLQQTNAGVSAARNLGIRAATGNWIALLDSDDEWHPDKLNQQQNALQHSGEARLVHCDEIWIRNGVRVNPKNRHRKTGGWIFEYCLPLCAISPSAAMIKTEVFDDIGLFDESLPACEDYDFWLRLTHREPVLYVEKTLLNKYGGHDDQLSKAHWGMDRFRIKSLFKLLKNGHSLSDSQKKSALNTLRGKVEVYGAGAEKRGRIQEAELLRLELAQLDVVEVQQ
ncbi:MAG: glycosyltransferase family 2 protein [Granulosicoccaceae bacterium]